MGPGLLGSAPPGVQEGMVGSPPQVRAPQQHAAPAGCLLQSRPRDHGAFLSNRFPGQAVAHFSAAAGLAQRIPEQQVAILLALGQQQGLGSSEPLLT